MSYENHVNERGERYVWLPPNVVDRLKAQRGPGESYSDVILRIAAGEGGRDHARRDHRRRVRRVSGPALLRRSSAQRSFKAIASATIADGYRSTEWQWQGMTIGQDSDGNRWTTSRWRDGDITTVTRPGR